MENHIDNIGRTTKTIQEAVQSFLDGFNVIVTGHTLKYAYDLQMLFYRRLKDKGIKCDKVKKYKIELNDTYAVFTDHLTTKSFIDTYYNKTYLLYNDHFNPNFK